MPGTAIGEVRNRGPTSVATNLGDSVAGFNFHANSRLGLIDGQLVLTGGPLCVSFGGVAPGLVQSDNAKKKAPKDFQTSSTILAVVGLRWFLNESSGRRYSCVVTYKINATSPIRKTMKPASRQGCVLAE